VQQQLQARARSAGLPQPTNKLHVAQDSIIARILSGADAIDASADPLRNASADPLRNASAAPFRNASNNDAPRFRLKMLVVVVPVAKKAVFNDLLKASSNFSAIGTWRSDAGQHNDCNAPNEVLTVEFEEARGDRISKGLCSAINAINILEANEEVLYMRIDPATGPKLPFRTTLPGYCQGAGMRGVSPDRKQGGQRMVRGRQWL
jgi:hypothetical protein